MHADEGEEEAEDEREDGLADVHVEHGREDRARHDRREHKAARPPERWHLMLRGGGVLVFLAELGRVAAREPLFRVPLDVLEPGEERARGEDDLREGVYPAQRVSMLPVYKTKDSAYSMISTPGQSSQYRGDGELMKTLRSLKVSEL